MFGRATKKVLSSLRISAAPRNPAPPTFSILFFSPSSPLFLVLSCSSVALLCVYVRASLALLSSRVSVVAQGSLGCVLVPSLPLQNRARSTTSHPRFLRLQWSQVTTTFQRLASQTFLTSFALPVPAFLLFFYLPPGFSF